MMKDCEKIIAGHERFFPAGERNLLLGLFVKYEEPVPAIRPLTFPRSVQEEIPE